MFTTRSARHRGYRRRSIVGMVLTLVVGVTTFLVAGRPEAVAAGGAVEVPKAACAAIDPNLVNGACLRYSTPSGTYYTWIGSYRADDGRIFFCIDYLYSSAIAATASVQSTAGLVNQFGQLIGGSEVAALTYLINKYASGGSTSSDLSDAAIALLFREVMSDGIKADGTVVYPPGLVVGGAVSAPLGLAGPITPSAQALWDEASAYMGSWAVQLSPTAPGPVPVGSVREYDVSVLSASGRLIPGVTVSFGCSGPIACPSSVTSADAPVRVSVSPSDLGSFTINASATGPAANGELLVTDWAPHDGSTARSNGVQRGWIATQEAAKAAVTGNATIVKATPAVVTQASPGQVDFNGAPAALRDVVQVSGLPAGYRQLVTASLFGPFREPPTASSCVAEKLIGEATFEVDRNGSFTTGTIAAPTPGFYVWTESLPGDRLTNPLTTPCGMADETTAVRATPALRTQASAQKVEIWQKLRDTIAVSGTYGSTLSIEWSLLGPIKPSGTSCEGLEWSGAAVADHGVVQVTGDGEVVTPETRVDQLGCYTYVERAAETPLSAAVESAPGQVTETALVIPLRRQWTLATRVNEQRLTVGAWAFDTIAVDGLGLGDSAEVEWSLLGPLAPGDAGCNGLDWRGAPVAARGVLRVDRNGTFETPPVVVDRVGCFTYAESAAETDTTAKVSSAPGQPSETTLALRPAAELVPEIPSGFVGHAVWWLPGPVA